MLDREPHYFVCDFSDDLDDYETEFQLWSVSFDARQRESEWQALWVAWRTAHDRGERPPKIEHDAAFAELSRCLEEFRRRPADAIRAVPEWKLDPNRSYAIQVPQHHVRWQVIDR